MLPEQCINNEVLNYHMALLNDRDARDREGRGFFPRCHFFSTFFYAKLENNGYEGVRYLVAAQKAPC